MLELFGLRRKTPSWKDYKEDRFYGMLWRWSYWGREVIDLWCFCPVCDTVLVYGEDRHVGTTTFSCETCNRLTGQEAGDKDYVFAKVKRQIDRKIRTGEWSKALESTQRANPTQRTQE